MCKCIDSASWERIVRKQIVTENAFFYRIEKVRLGLFPQFLSLLVEVNDLSLRSIGYFLAKSQVFKAGYSKRNACIGIWNFILHVTCSQSFNTLYLQMIEKQVLGYW